MRAHISPLVRTLVRASLVTVVVAFSSASCGESGNSNGGGVRPGPGPGGGGLPGGSFDAGGASQTDGAVKTPIDGGGLPVEAGTTNPGVDSGPTANATHFVVYGDSRTNADKHQTVVDAFAKVNPQMVLTTGDLWDEYSSGSTKWKSIVTKNQNIADLLNRNLFLISLGNHETIDEVLAFSPPIVRENKERYAFSFGNSFFVSMGMDPADDTAFLERQLQSPAATNATWRFVFSHFPIYSGGPHGGSGNATIEKLCDKYHVAVYFCGHDHLYERSHQMYNRAIADKGDALSVAKGSVYIVTGGGGAPLYATGRIASMHTTQSTLHFVDVNATTTSVAVKTYVPNGSVIDSFTIAR